MTAGSVVSSPVRVLVELRPALDGHSGIPQETRLIFAGLARLPGLQVEGLIQSSNLVTEPGLPLVRGEPDPGFPASSRIDCLSRAVVSLQQHRGSGRLGRLRRPLQFYGHALGWLLRGLAGRTVPLTGFDATAFTDFVWRALFAKSLPAADFDVVMRCRYRLLRQPWSMAHAVGVATAALGLPVYPRVRTDNIDLLLAETPFPGRVPAGTTLVVRYHDAIPLLLPHTIKNMSHHRESHWQALRRNVRDGAWFACVSEATRRDLLQVLPEAGERAVTIPNMISHHYRPDGSPPQAVHEIIGERQGGPAAMPTDVTRPLRYLLMVATLEPRKNHLMLLEAWRRLRAAGHGELHLVLVGSPGWHHEEITRAMAPSAAAGTLHMLQGVPSDDLRVLYRHAAATVCPSSAEGFDFPGVEAMRSGGVVVASDIPVHRDIFADGAAYFGPYSVDDLAATLADFVGEGASHRVEQLRATGTRLSQAYTPENVMPMWRDFIAARMRR